MVQEVVRREVVSMGDRPESHEKPNLGTGMGSPWVWNTKCKARALVYIEHSRTSGQPMTEAEWNARWAR